MIVYSIKNKINGKMYIGQTTQKFNVRRNDHFRALRKNKHENPHLQYSWNKYGESSFEFSIVQECNDQDESDFIETYWIETLKPILYNIRSGGNGGCKFDDDSRKRMSEAHRKRHFEDLLKRGLIKDIEEYEIYRNRKKKYPKRYDENSNQDSRKRMSESQRKRYEENPSFLSEIAKKQWQNPEMRKFQINRLKDLWKDPIRRAKMVKNLQCTPEEKSRRGKMVWTNPEYRAKFEKSYGKVMSPTGEIYEVCGLLKFCKKHSLDPSTFSNMCYGKFKQYKGWIKLND